MSLVVTALLDCGQRNRRAQREKQALSRLDAVLAMTRDEVEDEMVDVRKKELLARIPFLNRSSCEIEIAPNAPPALSGEFEVDSGKCSCLSRWSLGCRWCYLIDLRTGVFALSGRLGIDSGGCPFAFVLNKRRGGFKNSKQGCRRHWI